MPCRHEEVLTYFCVNIGLLRPEALALQYIIYPSDREKREALRLYQRIENAAQQAVQIYNDPQAKQFRIVSLLGELFVSTQLSFHYPCNWRTFISDADHTKFEIEGWDIQEITPEIDVQLPVPIYHHRLIRIKELTEKLQPWLARTL